VERVKLLMKTAFIAFCFMLLLHLDVVAASSVDSGVVFWWVKPGVYFTYHDEVFRGQ
jgi:hypothetical protein